MDPGSSCNEGKWCCPLQIFSNVATGFRDFIPFSTTLPSVNYLADLSSWKRIFKGRFLAKMPPKGAKADKGPSKKTEQKKKEKIIEV